LQRGSVVALPTETVYGLAGDAMNDEAVTRIFESKSRPRFDPLIVHLPHRDSLPDVAQVPEEIESILPKFLDRFWPGPLTILLPKQPAISDLITAGLPHVAVRISGHAVFRKVIGQLGRPLAAPSANRFGRISPTSASAVMEELGGEIPLILDGGACREGLESTIIGIAPGPKKPVVTILRPGPVTREDLKQLGKIQAVRREAGSIEAPGQTDSHYAPIKPLKLLADPADFTPEPDKRYALLSYRGDPADGYLSLTDFVETSVLSPGSGKLPEAAVRFFYSLRQLDQSSADEIIAEPLPKRGLGVAIMDRLERAAAPKTKGEGRDGAHQV
ncbi:MAG: L-threonylcarbamoyladenylate synthase, partial [Verrucomicrobiota bacterium]